MKTWQANALAILIGGAVGSLFRYGVNTSSVFVHSLWEHYWKTLVQVLF